MEDEQYSGCSLSVSLINCRLYVRKSGCNTSLQNESDDQVASIYNQSRIVLGEYRFLKSTAGVLGKVDCPVIWSYIMSSLN